MDTVEFDDYQKWIEKFIQNNDTREVNFQYDVVKRFLERLEPDYDIVSVDTKRRKSKNHNYFAYSGGYSKNDDVEPTTPDLLICKNWNWYNIEHEKEITYIATVEVKSPYGNEAIYKKDYKDYYDSWKTKIHRHLSAEKIEKVIFTDCFKWEFYTQEKEPAEEIRPDKEIRPVKEINLVDRVKNGRGYTYKWNGDVKDKFEELKEAIIEFLKVE